MEALGGRKRKAGRGGERLGRVKKLRVGATWSSQGRD